MKRQIFRSICAAAGAVFLAALVLILGVAYDYFSSVQMNGLKTETYIAAKAAESGGEEFLRSIADGDYRVTWIAADGEVLFDNRADSSQMENHLEREEIREALKNGAGESTRYSSTLAEQQLYCARRLADGTVLRLSFVHLSRWALMLALLQPIAVVLALALGLSVLLASRLSDRIVRPLNELDLEAPDTAAAYEELSPLLNRIASQKRQLSRQENELRRKKEEFDAATENMREGIILLGENGSVLSINRAASRILKISRGCVGKDLRLFSNTPELEELLRAAADGEPAEKAVELGGKEYQLNASPIVTDGKVTGTALIVFDITEKEKAETARREFTANVSHELKTPLQNISGSAELLAGGLVKPEDVQRFSETIYTEAKRMIALVDDIIKLSHLDENTSSFDFEKTDLLSLAEQTRRDLLPVAESKGVDFRLEGERTVISGIPSLLSEIMYNLCENAIKYNHRGGSVIMRVENRAGGAALSVEDTGIGIPPEEQERIFERFYRVDKSRSKEVGGTGLGLSIVKHAAIIHGAKIEVTSRPGSGTTFTVLFPKNREK